MHRPSDYRERRPEDLFMSHAVASTTPNVPLQRYCKSYPAGEPNKRTGPKITSDFWPALPTLALQQNSHLAAWASAPLAQHRRLRRPPQMSRSGYDADDHLEVEVKNLRPREELRLEIGDSKFFITLTQGTAEVYGADLQLEQRTCLQNTKIAIFSWSGCTVKLEGTTIETPCAPPPSVPACTEAADRDMQMSGAMSLAASIAVPC